MIKSKIEERSLADDHVRDCKEIAEDARKLLEIRSWKGVARVDVWGRITTALQSNRLQPEASSNLIVLGREDKLSHGIPFLIKVCLGGFPGWSGGFSR